MNYLNTLKISFNALKRNKIRTFLTMLGMIIGVASVIAMPAIGQGSKQSIQDEMSGMGTNLIFAVPGSEMRGGVRLGNEDAQNMTLDDVKAIRRECSAISAVSPEVRASGQLVFGNRNWPGTVYGANQYFPDIRKYDLATGRIFTEKEIRTYAKVCLLGQTVVENLFGDGTYPLGKTIRFNNIPLKIIGVLGEKGESGMGQDQDDLLVVPYTTIMKRVLSLNTITSLEKKLPGDRFMRVHRSYIVNLERIDTIERNRIVFGEKYIPVSDPYKEKFGDYIRRNFP